MGERGSLKKLNPDLSCPFCNSGYVVKYGKGQAEVPVRGLRQALLPGREAPPPWRSRKHSGCMLTE